MKTNTYLNFPGQTEAAFRFYEAAFQGTVTSLVRFKDMPMPGVTLPEADLDKLMHVTLDLGDGQVLMGSDTLASLGHQTTAGNNVYTSVAVDSREEADRLFAALSEGGEVEMAIADMPWGDYWGSFADRFGVRWMIVYSPPRG